MFVHYISFYSFSRSLTAIRLCWSATLFWKAIFSHLNFKPLLDYPTAQILPLWKRGKEAAINYYCSSPFPRSWELKDNKCCYADKLKVLCKLGIGTLQLSYFQGWLFKGLVKLILYQFLFMDFHLSGKFKFIKCLSIVSVHWKWTIKKNLRLTGSLYGKQSWAVCSLALSINNIFQLKSLPKEEISTILLESTTLLLYCTLHARTAGVWAIKQYTALAGQISSAAKDKQGKMC